MRPWVICVCLLVLYLVAICSVQADSDESDSDEKRGPRRRGRMSSSRIREFKIGARRYQRGRSSSSRSRTAYYGSRSYGQGSRSYGRTDRAFCVDLTLVMFTVPDDSKWFSFTPTRRFLFQPCMDQGIIRVKVPSWVKKWSSLSVQMTFGGFTPGTSGWAFHIGDTESNTGLNTDMVPQGAQVVDQSGTLNAYMNSPFMNNFENEPWSSAGMYIQVFKNDFFYNDHEGLMDWAWPGGSNRFFSFPEDDYIYVGLNRVIKSKSDTNDEPYDDRYGEGLCTACVWWNE